MAAVLAQLHERFDLSEESTTDGAGPARYLSSSDKRLRIGLITPLSQHFCATCNRVRLTAEGRLHTCLGDEGATDLGALLRAGADDTALHTAITSALACKPAGHDFVEAPQRRRRTMSVTGG
jgi:cyclic pyranopterin phosphate synthase